MRKWRPATAPSDEEWQVSHQIVFPKSFHNDVLSLAHSLPLAGHLGVNKTYRKVLSCFIAWTERGCCKVLQDLSYLSGSCKAQLKTKSSPTEAHSRQ